MRSIGHPDFEYNPWSDDRRAAASARVHGRPFSKWPAPNPKISNPETRIAPLVIAPGARVRVSKEYPYWPGMAGVLGTVKRRAGHAVIVKWDTDKGPSNGTGFHKKYLELAE